MIQQHTMVDVADYSSTRRAGFSPTHATMVDVDISMERSVEDIDDVTPNDNPHPKQ